MFHTTRTSTCSRSFSQTYARALGAVSDTRHRRKMRRFHFDDDPVYTDARPIIHSANDTLRIARPTTMAFVSCAVSSAVKSSDERSAAKLPIRRESIRLYSHSAASFELICASLQNLRPPRVGGIHRYTHHCLVILAHSDPPPLAGPVVCTM